MKMMLAPGLLIAVGCASVPEGETPPEGSGACRTEGLLELAGQPATQALGAEALRRSTARALRWIRPGDMVTMDYREDRLNIHLDAAGQVERFACG
jgi:hypothetical protein